MQNALKRLLNQRVSTIGLEIGTSMIKVVELRPGSPPALVRSVSAPTPPGSVKEGALVEPQLVAQEISNLLTAQHIKARFVVTALPNQSAITRNISVPRVDRKDLDGAVRWEAERYIPYPIDEVVLDYDLLDEPAGLPQDSPIEIVIAAAPQEVIARQVEAIRLAGLEPLIIDLKPFAALRAVYAAQKSPEPHLTSESDVAVILEIGASGTSITLVRGQRVLMTRNITVSADDFTVAIQRGYNLSFAEAEEVKTRYATVSSQTESEEDLLNFDADRERYATARLYELTRPVLSDLINEVRRSLEFYRVQSGEVILSRMLITGGGAKLRGLPGALSDALGMKVELAHPLSALSVDPNHPDTELANQLGEALAVPIGLALRGMDRLD